MDFLADFIQPYNGENNLHSMRW